jgi:hypothetical protein
MDHMAKKSSPSARRLMGERGATDPILIIAGIAITLILIVGGSFAVSGFIGNAHDVNAKGDLDRIATAEAAHLATKDAYAPYRVGPRFGEDYEDRSLEDSDIGFTPTDGNDTVVQVAETGWVAATRSASGKVFVRSSETTAPAEPQLSAAQTVWGVWDEQSKNYFANPDLTYDVVDGITTNTGTTVTRTQDAGGNWKLNARSTGAVNTGTFDVSSLFVNDSGVRGWSTLHEMNPAIWGTRDLLNLSFNVTLDAPVPGAGATLTVGTSHMLRNGGNFTYTQSRTIPNQAGTHKVVLPIHAEPNMNFTTVPAGATNFTSLKLLAGTTAVPLKYDNFVLQKSASGDWFSGDSVGAYGQGAWVDPNWQYRGKWAGTPGQTVSILESRSSYSTPGGLTMASDFTIPEGIDWDAFGAEVAALMQ